MEHVNPLNPNNVNPPIKRGPGRPRKIIGLAAERGVEPVKRPVGRPRKEVAAAATPRLNEIKRIPLGRQYALPKKSGWVLITPELAKAWLMTCNLLNRPMKKRYVARLVRDLLNGNWVVNQVEGIAFDTDRVLLDGQHRLEAVVESGVSVKMWVWLDQPVEVRKVLDTGEVRKPAEILHMEGVQYSSWIVPTINLINRLENGKMWNPKTSTTADIRQYLNQHPELKQQVPWVGCSVLYQVYKSIAVPCACFNLLHRVYPAETEKFFTELRDGVAPTANSPVAMLRNYLATVDPKDHPRITQSQKVVSTYKAFRAYLSGDMIMQLRVRQDESLPKLQ